MKRMYSDEQICPRLYEHRLHFSKEVVWDEALDVGGISDLEGKTVTLHVQLRYITTSADPVTLLQFQQPGLGGNYGSSGVLLVEVNGAYFEDAEENTYSVFDGARWIAGALMGTAGNNDLTELATFNVGLVSSYGSATYAETMVKQI